MCCGMMNTLQKVGTLCSLFRFSVVQEMCWRNIICTLCRSCFEYASWTSIRGRTALRGPKEFLLPGYLAFLPESETLTYNMLLSPCIITHTNDSRSHCIGACIFESLQTPQHTVKRIFPLIFSSWRFSTRPFPTSPRNQLAKMLQY